MGRPKGCTKNPHDLCATDIIKKITKSNITDLSVDDMTEAITAYTNAIVKLLMLETCPEDIKLAIPNIGKVTFKKKIGLKAGSTYKTSVDFGKTKDENGNTIMEVVEVTEDMPDYLRVYFEISPTLQKNLREETEKRWYRKNGK